MGTFHVKHVSGGESREFDSPNLITDRGLNLMLRRFKATDSFNTRGAKGMIGLIDDTGFVAISSDDQFRGLGDVELNAWEEFQGYSAFIGENESSSFRIEILTGTSVAPGIHTWGGGEDQYAEFTRSGVVRGIFIANGDGSSRFQGGDDDTHSSAPFWLPEFFAVSEFDTPLQVREGDRLYPSYTLEANYAS